MYFKFTRLAALQDGFIVSQLHCQCTSTIATRSSAVARWRKFFQTLDKNIQEKLIKVRFYQRKNFAIFMLRCACERFKFLATCFQLRFQMDMECNTFYRHLIKKSMKVFALYFSRHHLLFCYHFPGYITFLCQYVSHCQHILYISTLLFPFTPTVNIYLVFLFINCISYANLIQSSCR